MLISYNDIALNSSMTSQEFDIGDIIINTEAPLKPYYLTW
jgi:hypothetical protein